MTRFDLPSLVLLDFSSSCSLPSAIFRDEGFSVLRDSLDGACLRKLSTTIFYCGTSMSSCERSIDLLAFVCLFLRWALINDWEADIFAAFYCRVEWFAELET